MFAVFGENLNPFNTKLIFAHSPNHSRSKWLSDVVRNDCSVNFHLSKLSVAKFSVLYDISLVRDWKRKFKLITLGSERVKNNTIGSLSNVLISFHIIIGILFEVSTHWWMPHRLKAVLTCSVQRKKRREVNENTWQNELKHWRSGHSYCVSFTSLVLTRKR